MNKKNIITGLCGIILALNSCATSGSEEIKSLKYPEIAKKYVNEWDEGAFGLMSGSYTAVGCSPNVSGIFNARESAENKAREIILNYLKENQKLNNYEIVKIAERDFAEKNGIHSCVRVYAKSKN